MVSLYQQLSSTKTLREGEGRLHVTCNFGCSQPIRFTSSHIKTRLNQNQLALIKRMVLSSKIQRLNYGAPHLGLAKFIYQYIMVQCLQPWPVIENQYEMGGEHGVLPSGQSTQRNTVLLFCFIDFFTFIFYIFQCWNHGQLSASYSQSSPTFSKTSGK